MKHFLLILLAFGLTACISDDISTSPSDLPDFSADTLALGDIWAEEFSPNGAITVYNRHSEGIIVSEIAISGRDADCVKVNVDGSPLEQFVPVEIRANDSIIILASAIPQQGSLEADIYIKVNSVVKSIPVAAKVHTPTTIRDEVVAEDLTLSGEVRIFGNLTIEPSATLTIAPGTTIYMHDNAAITVGGAITAEGTAQQPITFCGDRFGYIAANIPYSILPGQWSGLTVNSSVGNSLSHTSLLNMEEGLTLAEDASLLLTNCCIANSRGNLISLAPGASLEAVGCQMTEAARAVLALNDASAQLYRCTIANYYLFGAALSSAIALDGASTLDVAASIIYRPGGEMTTASASTYKFADCLFGSNGSDDANFVNCLWGANPLFLIDMDNYNLDYRIAPESPARAHSAAPGEMAADRYGIPTPAVPPLGAYN